MRSFLVQWYHSSREPEVARTKRERKRAAPKKGRTNPYTSRQQPKLNPSDLRLLHFLSEYTRCPEYCNWTNACTYAKPGPQISMGRRQVPEDARAGGLLRSRKTLTLITGLRGLASAVWSAVMLELASFRTQ